MRIFIAIPLPAEVKERLNQVSRDFAKFPAKWVEEENLHITLVFVGEVSEEDKIGKISGVLDNVNCGPITLEVGGLSLFPSEKEARLLVAKIGGEEEKLAQLSEKIKDGLRKEKIGFDEKPFRPHITLARFKDIGSKQQKALRAEVGAIKLPKMKFAAKEIMLVESQLTPTGPIYRVIGASPLGQI